MIEQVKKSLRGTNFWVAIFLFSTGIFVGFPDGAARDIVGGIFGTIGGIFAVREYLKSPAIDLRAWLSSANTWNYLLTIVVSIFPMFPSVLLEDGRQVVDGLLAGNLQGTIIAGLSLLTKIYHLFIKKQISQT